MKNPFKKNPVIKSKFIACVWIEVDDLDGVGDHIVEELDATNLEEAHKEVADLLESWGCGDDENDAQFEPLTIKIHEIKQSAEFDLKAWKKKKAEELKKADAEFDNEDEEYEDEELTVAEEMELLKKLKSKYEPDEETQDDDSADSTDTG